MNIQGGMGQMPVGVGGNMAATMGQAMQGPVGMGPGMGGPMGAMGGMAGGMAGGGGPGVMQPMQTMGVSSPMASGMMHGPSPQNPGTPGQMPTPMAQQQSQEKLDNISKVKSLVGPLRETLTQTLKTAAQTLHQNHLIDAGSIKGVDQDKVPRFDKSIEEFYSICDQIELHLKTAQECVAQGTSSGRYLPFPVTPTRTEPMAAQDGNSLTYPQYLATTRSQIAYVKDIHDSLTATVQNLASTD